MVEPINRLLETVPFDAVFYSLDWHPSDHVSFIDNLPMRKLHHSSPVSSWSIEIWRITFLNRLVLPFLCRDLKSRRIVWIGLFYFQLTAEEANTYDTVIFEGPPMMKQRLWPRHCVQDSWGAELHKDLKVTLNAVNQNQ